MLEIYLLKSCGNCHYKYLCFGFRKIASLVLVWYWNFFDYHLYTALDHFYYFLFLVIWSVWDVFADRSKGLGSWHVSHWRNWHLWPVFYFTPLLSSFYLNGFCSLGHKISDCFIRNKIFTSTAGSNYLCGTYEWETIQ